MAQYIIEQHLKRKQKVQNKEEMQEKYRLGTVNINTVVEHKPGFRSAQYPALILEANITTKYRTLTT